MTGTPTLARFSPTLQHMFAALYRTVERWAWHHQAERYLALMAFSGSSIFPLPVEMMLAPMVFARPAHAMRLGMLTAIASVLGGLLGYALGYFAIDLVMPWINALGYGRNFEQVLNWFDRWGFWVVFVAGFAPLPYKLFTIAAGALMFPLAPFFVASAISRIARFLLMSWLFATLGPRLSRVANRYVEWIGWSMVAGLLGVVLLSH